MGLAPTYTPETEALGEVLDHDQVPTTGIMLEMAIARLPYRRRKQGGVVGSDGYKWFWVLHFATPKGNIYVAIPTSYDEAREDGTERDRAVAVYVEKDVALKVVQDLLTGLIKSISGVQSSFTT
jgi:hypothetical protein